jgi:hypothetical protein
MEEIINTLTGIAGFKEIKKGLVYGNKSNRYEENDFIVDISHPTFDSTALVIIDFVHNIPLLRGIISNIHELKTALKITGVMDITDDMLPAGSTDCPECGSILWFNQVQGMRLIEHGFIKAMCQKCNSYYRVREYQVKKNK